MEIIKVKMQAIDIKKPLTFGYYKTIKKAKAAAKAHIKKNYNKFEEEKRNIRGGTQITYITEKEDLQYYITFKFETITVVE